MLSLWLRFLTYIGLLYLVFFLVLLLFAGCTTTTRLGPGECVVLTDPSTVIVAGQGCGVQRIYR